MSEATKNIKVLIVDDNAQYREAFKRTLLIENFDVCEAENADEAITVIQLNSPDVIVTDLQMRTHREGLELIKKIKGADPIIPVIMISAVGSFEEGALATKLGASYVIHKSRIEEEMDNFYSTIEISYKESVANKQLLKLIESAKILENPSENPQLIERIKMILNDPSANSYIKSEAYDFIASISEAEMLKESGQTLQHLIESRQQKEIYNKTLQSLKESITHFGLLDQDSKEALITSEYLYHQQEELHTVDLSRNIGFSYCFAVENEAKEKLKRKFNRFFTNPDAYILVESLLDPKTNQLDIFFHQYILVAQRGYQIEFTIDNVRQTFMRILEHRGKYKPDGLKAIGIILVCFGREYSFKKQDKSVAIKNPLNLKGLNSNEEVLVLSELLVNLQHFRNPYIHPEINEMQKLSKLRDMAFKCINFIGKLV